ncbi:MAG: aminotransferase class I/II-fold pyridoxal phosphate-dependent enzyme [Rhodospirillaceae bacterium]|nr:aminotransferase class I/II-fold pyridoxal phosphate-dependent enzyme [Rhodospirillaceae bacterium]
MPDTREPARREPRAAATIAAHDEAFPLGAVVPPIYQTSLFTFATYDELAARFRGEGEHPVYSRVDNPTTAEFERKLAALEGAEAARGFASGMGAIATTILGLVKQGERILCVRYVYPDAYRLMRKLLPRLGIAVEFVDGADPAAVERALPGARLLYLESPTSLVFRTQELGRLAALARRHGVLTVADNSWASPIFQRPLEHGVDLVLHSASKYLGGHSDVVAGVVAGSRALIAAIDDVATPYLGAKLSPLDAWLLVRGLRTLPLRMRRHHESGLALAERLAGHPGVVRVLHPAFANEPGCATLSGWSGLFSIELADDIDIRVFCDALAMFKLGVSWGGHESLAFPARISRQQAGGANAVVEFDVSPRLVRLHVGLEDVEDLWRDLEQALKRARQAHG